MNNLVFTALCLALLYYLFYRPSPKSNANRPPPHNKETQTNRPLSNKSIQTDPELTEIIIDPGIDKAELAELKKDIQRKESTIIGLNNSYEKLETKKAEEIDELKKELQRTKNWGARFINSHEIIFGPDLEGSQVQHQLLTLLVYGEKVPFGINFKNVDKPAFKLFKQAFIEHIYKRYA